MPVPVSLGTSGWLNAKSGAKSNKSTEIIANRYVFFGISYCFALKSIWRYVTAKHSILFVGLLANKTSRFPHLWGLNAELCG